MRYVLLHLATLLIPVLGLSTSRPPTHHKKFDRLLSSSSTENPSCPVGFGLVPFAAFFSRYIKHLTSFNVARIVSSVLNLASDRKQQDSSQLYLMTSPVKFGPMITQFRISKEDPWISNESSSRKVLVKIASIFPLQTTQPSQKRPPLQFLPPSRTAAKNTCRRATSQLRPLEKTPCYTPL